MIAPEDEAVIRQLGMAWDDGWNGHDMDALADLVTPDVDFIHVMGGWLGGRDAFQKYHAERHADAFKASVTRTLGMAIRPLTPVICLVHRNWRMEGGHRSRRNAACDAEGGHYYLGRPPRRLKVAHRRRP
jgi:uncharacterized protein (TIGR02246 family)